MIQLGFLISIAVLLTSWLLFKKITNPPFILSLMWCIIYAIEMISGFSIDNNDIKFCIFSIGAMIFLIGYSLGNIVHKKSKCIDNTKIIYTFNSKHINQITTVNLLLFIIIFFKICIYVLNNYSINIWQTIVLYKKSWMIIYYSPFAYAISLICIVVAFKNKYNKKYAFLNLIPALVMAVLSGNRSNIIMVIISNSFAILGSKKINNFKLMKKIIKLFIVVLIIFLIIARFKFTNLKHVAITEFIFTMLKLYLATPMIAFVNWFNMGFEQLNGENTFRFFIALFNRLGRNIAPQETVQQFISIDGVFTNVYTIYQYYVKDFGIAYAFFIEFILGMLYGHIFKKLKFKRNNLFYTCISSYLYYPLIMQFYADAYFAYLSFWIQIAIWFYILTRKWLIKAEYIEGDD